MDQTKPTKVTQTQSYSHPSYTHTALLVNLVNKSFEGVLGFTPRAIKKESTSPIAKGLGSSWDRIHAQKKWKRITVAHNQIKSEGIELGTKRKEDLMEVDDIFSWGY